MDTPRLKGIPIGIDDFKKLRERNCLFVDKSLFIKEIIDDPSEVKLITRPRRFGKTLNLSMLRYFFEKSHDDSSTLFNDLSIWKEGEYYTSELGQYPVVTLTFKDVKEKNFDYCIGNIKQIIGKEFRRHDYILRSDRINEFDKEQFVLIENESSDYIKLKYSLNILTDILQKYYDKEVIVLIDEYDTPINSGYTYGYYEDIIDFMRNFLGSGLKGNPNLRTAVITGIYRVAKESIFSGFNNIKVCSVLHNAYSDKFGFTDEEVEDVLDYYGIDIDINEVGKWYNGYIFGDNTVIYNPWSILNYADNKVLQPYWVNTSSNDIIRDILAKTGSNVKKKLGILLDGGVLKGETIDTDTNFRHIIGKKIIGEDILWSLLLVSGYLKQQNLTITEGRTKCDLKIPNKEIGILYEDIISGWFEGETVTTDKISELLKDLVSGDIDDFTQGFKYLVRNTFSYFDVGDNSSENFYHAFILGILVNLDDKYKVLSNRESGNGRPDVIIIPQDNNKKGVIMEFKVSRDAGADALRKKAHEAMAQIENMNYIDELVSSGIKEAIEMAIVFHGKEIYVEYRTHRL